MQSSCITNAMRDYCYKSHEKNAETSRIVDIYARVNYLMLNFKRLCFVFSIPSCFKRDCGNGNCCKNICIEYCYFMLCAFALACRTGWSTLLENNWLSRYSAQSMIKRITLRSLTGHLGHLGPLYFPFKAYPCHVNKRISIIIFATILKQEEKINGFNGNEEKKAE